MNAQTKFDGKNITPFPSSPLEIAYRDSLCEDLRDAVWALMNNRAEVAAPITDAQALVIGLALADLRKLVDGWRK